jgi:hypothetical protein
MNATLAKRLAQMRQRVQICQGLTAAADNLAGLDRTLELALDDSADARARREAEVKRQNELLTAARRGNQDAIQELNELHMETVDLYVRASSTFASMFFEVITLKPNEQFCIQTTHKNQVRVKYLAQDSGATTVKAVRAQKQQFVDMRELHTSAIGYQMRDIQQGNDIAAASQATVDLGWEMTNKVDNEAFCMLQGGTINGANYGSSVYAAFKTTGSMLDRTYVPHGRIHTPNLPTTNKLVLEDNGTTAGKSNKFRLNVIRAIMKYCDSWGQIFGQPIRPTGAILIPSSETTDLATEIVPTGTFYNQVAEGILNRYTRFQYMDINWTLIPDVTIPPGLCYPVLSRPVGKLLVKPSFDQEFVESFPRKNWEERSMMKCLAMTILEPDRVNGLSVQYSSEYSALSTTE